MDRLMRALDDPTVGLPPKELANAGLGARLWQFGTAGGDVLRERAAAETTGQWSPEFAKSRDWLSKAPRRLQELPTPPVIQNAQRERVSILGLLVQVLLVSFDVLDCVPEQRILDVYLIRNTYHLSSFFNHR